VEIQDVVHILGLALEAAGEKLCLLGNGGCGFDQPVIAQLSPNIADFAIRHDVHDESDETVGTVAAPCFAAWRWNIDKTRRQDRRHPLGHRRQERQGYSQHEKS
jgi:hypothetical protein